MAEQNIGIRGFEIIVRELDFRAVKHVTIAYAIAIKIEVKAVICALHIHRQTLQAIGQLAGDQLDIDPADLDALLAVDSDGWKQAVPQIREHFARFGDKLPGVLNAAVDELESALA